MRFNAKEAIESLKAWGSAQVQLADSLAGDEAGPKEVAAATRVACLTLDVLPRSEWSSLAAGGSASNADAVAAAARSASFQDGCIINGKTARYTPSPAPGSRTPFAILTETGH